MTNLRQQFLNDLAEQGQASFTFGIAKHWYASHKRGPAQAYATNVYTMIINPLLAEGLISKASVGLYYIYGAPAGVPAVVPTAPKELDEFDSYLKGKGVR